MKIRKHITTLALALVLGMLMLPALGSAKNPVQRPFLIHGKATWVINVDPQSPQFGWGDMLDVGEATHCGKYINEGFGIWDLGAMTIASAGGTATAANGDQLFWEMPGDLFSVQWSGGTGRFDQLSGGFNVVHQSAPEIGPGVDPGTITVTVTYLGKGACAY